MTVEMKWKKSKTCKKCGHVHERIEEAKTNALGVCYCTWCSDTAPPLFASRSKRYR